jgi:hypothetical protein
MEYQSFQGDAEHQQGGWRSTALVDPPLVHITNNLLQIYKYLHFLNTRQILYACIALQFDTEFYRICPTR